MSFQVINHGAVESQRDAGKRRDLLSAGKPPFRSELSDTTLQLESARMISTRNLRRREAEIKPFNLKVTTNSGGWRHVFDSSLPVISFLIITLSGFIGAAPDAELQMKARGRHAEPRAFLHRRQQRDEGEGGVRVCAAERESGRAGSWGA